MDRIAAFLQLVSAYSAARGVSEARISTLIFDHGARIKKLRDGADIGSKNLEKAMFWFDERWPADLAWPVGVPRLKRPDAGVAAPPDRPLSLADAAEAAA